MNNWMNAGVKSKVKWTEVSVQMKGWTQKHVCSVAEFVVELEVKNLEARPNCKKKTTLTQKNNEAMIEWLTDWMNKWINGGSRLRSFVTILFHIIYYCFKFNCLLSWFQSWFLFFWSFFLVLLLKDAAALTMKLLLSSFVSFQFFCCTQRFGVYLIS